MIHAVPKQGEYYKLVVAFHINLFFSSQKKFCRKVLVMVIGVLHIMKVKCDLLQQKNYHDLLH